MFTGLIEAMGRVTSWTPQGEGARLTMAVAWPSDTKEPAIGDSVAVNGCCLTVVEVGAAPLVQVLAFDLSHETLACTAFASIKPGERLNCERAMCLGDRLGGHLVTGHVDGVAKLIDIAVREGAWDLTYSVPASLEAELVVKGSVALDGVSLTVNALPPGKLQVTIIPHTASHTQLIAGGAGKAVHIETDLLAKHVRRLVQLGGAPPLPA